MKYKVLSRSSCERYSTQKHGDSSVIISIRSSWDKVLPKLETTDKNNIKGVLYLSFNDIDKPSPGSMKILDGELIADFVNKYYEQVDTIIVHCDGGISRSAGVAAAIMRVKEGSDYDIFKLSTKHPNMWCYLKTLQGFKYV